MTITNGYATLAEYKSWNTIDTTSATDDAVIEQIIESVSRQIDSICARVFYVTTATVRYFNTDDSNVLYTDDISALTSLEVATDLDGDGVHEVVWASTDYNLLPYQSTRSWPYNGIERASNSIYAFSRMPRGNKVTALWGWSAVPADVKTACLIAVDAEYHARNGQNLSVDTQISAMGVVMTPRGLPKSALDKLRPYMRFI
jgi:hypothetical protein